MPSLWIAVSTKPLGRLCGNLQCFVTAVHHASVARALTSPLGWCRYTRILAPELSVLDDERMRLR